MPRASLASAKSTLMDEATVAPKDSSSAGLLRRKQLRKTSGTHAFQMVMQVICSFPERMTREATTPPFIHVTKFSCSRLDPPSDDQIRICQEICRQKATISETALWAAVASEQERLYTLRTSNDRWVHLKSAQAVMIYIIMLAVEGEGASAH